mmetsp:Transcript_29360/g.41078  ORF Transcript_29360/g.41078 Transcript_29360/m.41078 type:complete len:183 (-) Transcript_29360:403-951(-)
MESIFVSRIRAMLGVVFDPEEPPPKSPTARHFEPAKDVSEKDMVIVDMLNSQGHEDICYCVCDPDQADMPIVFASDGFCDFTGYNHTEIEGRNCRFLQGQDTSPDDVQRIRNAIKDEVEASVNLLNYRKDGTTFVNEFFIAPLHDNDKKTTYFIGVQCAVPFLGPGQMPSNTGWVYSQGKHV